MSASLNERGQTSFETIMLAGFVLIMASFIGSKYFGEGVADQTTAIIILKTELLKALNSLEKNYVLVGSLEPRLETDGTLCFAVQTRPNTTETPDDHTTLQNSFDAIKTKIAAKTKYNDTGKICILLNHLTGCPESGCP